MALAVHYFSYQTTDVVTPIIGNQGQHPCSTPNERRVTCSKVFVSYQREFNRMSPRTLIKHDWAVPRPPCASSLSAFSLHRYHVAVFHSFNQGISMLFYWTFLFYFLFYICKIVTGLLQSTCNVDKHIFLCITDTQEHLLSSYPFIVTVYFVLLIWSSFLDSSSHYSSKLAV